MLIFGIFGVVHEFIQLPNINVLSTHGTYYGDLGIMGNTMMT